MIDVKRAVKPAPFGGPRVVYFKYYVDNNLWYETEYDERFPVPISDVGTAMFLAQDKAILFMRWMRAWNEKLAKAEPYSHYSPESREASLVRARELKAGLTIVDED